MCSSGSRQSLHAGKKLERFGEAESPSSGAQGPPAPAGSSLLPSSQALGFIHRLQSRNLYLAKLLVSSDLCLSSLLRGC